MKGLTSIATAFLLGCMILLAPASSRAADDVIDCSGGCLIMTCSDSGTCTIWECNGDGCQPVGVFTRLTRSEKMYASSVDGQRSRNGRPPSGAKVCEFEREPCAIKVCERDKCEVSIFDGTAFLPAAVVDNVDSVVDRAHRKITEDRLER